MAIATDWRRAPLASADYAMLEFCEKLTLAPATMAAADVAALRLHGFTDREILAIVLAAAYRNFILRAREHLAIEHVPAFWRVLAHQPRLLRATWAKDRTGMSAGEFSAPAKACVALAVAMFKQSPYWTAYLAHHARRVASLDDAALVKLAGAVRHYVSYNTIAHGMRLEPAYTDMTAADFRSR